jgi:hypothetical protein
MYIITSKIVGFVVKKRSTAIERNSRRASIGPFWAANVLVSQEKQTAETTRKIFPIGPKPTQNFLLSYDISEIQH